MFAHHQRIISTYGRASPDNLGRVLTFVLASIRKRLIDLPADMENIEHGPANVLYGWKPAAMLGIINAKVNAWETCEDILARNPDPADALVYHLSHLTGFGYAKAGFAVQLLYGLSGCIDGHNAARLGLNVSRVPFRAPAVALTPAGRQAHVARYNAVIADCGGSAALWDMWCTSIAQEQPDVYRSAHHASALHCEALGLDC